MSGEAVPVGEALKDLLDRVSRGPSYDRGAKPGRAPVRHQKRHRTRWHMAVLLSGLSANAKHVAGALASGLWTDTEGRCRRAPKNAELSARTSRGEKVVMAALAELENSGWLFRSGAKGKGKPWEYQLMLPVAGEDLLRDHDLRQGWAPDRSQDLVIPSDATEFDPPESGGSTTLRPPQNDKFDPPESGGSTVLTPPKSTTHERGSSSGLDLPERQDLPVDEPGPAPAGGPSPFPWIRIGITRADWWLLPRSERSWIRAELSRETPQPRPQELPHDPKEAVA